uniref:HD-GYP domain-containing protein n=1 Tax=Candidatus Stercorousia sp. TaxID=3048886 RepID=UPI004026ED07
MKNEENKNGVSLFSQSDYLIGQDPIEEIFALNLGDFIAENLISEDLARKIGNSVKDKKSGLINQLKELISIYSLQNTLCVLSFDKSEEQAIYTSIAYSVKQMLEIQACHIYLEKNNELDLVGTTSSSIEKFQIDESTPAGRAFMAKESVFDKDVTVIPMHCNIKSTGVILLENSEQINREYIDLVESIAILFATSMTLQHTIDETNKLIDDENSSASDLQHMRAELTALIGDLCDYQQSFVENLANAVDTKGGYKVSHSKNTAKLARQLCKQLGLNEKTTDLIYYAGLLQNIGKIALPEKIFATNGKLSAEELQKIQEHSNIGVHLLMNINFLSEVVPYITYQKERYDGTGSPEGLKGQSIPFGSRIIAVADAYSAMTSDRPYRKAMPVDKALEIMQSEAGTKWDPVVINALADAVK